MKRLIPTSSKYKLPKHLSYPMGAEEISHHLEDAQQYDELSLCFLECSRVLMSNFVRDIKDKKNITIIKFCYRPSSSGPSVPRHDERNRHGEDWSIYVFPVPSQVRDDVRRQLTEVGMVKALQWLSALSLASLRLSRKQFNIRYDLSKGEINFSEGLDRI